MAFNDIPQYRQWIVREAQKQGVPSDLALRLATRESGMWQYDNHGALLRSSKGALGIMQVMPGTAPDMDLSDPEQNIVAGVRELARLFHGFESWTLAVAAYNAGEGRLHRALQGMARIPQETREYVQAILGQGSLRELLVVTSSPAGGNQERTYSAMRAMPRRPAQTEIKPQVWVAGALIGAALFLLWNS